MALKIQYKRKKTKKEFANHHFCFILNPAWRPTCGSEAG
jgi:hypothetical protein